MNLEHHLRAQILDGRLPPGARLPSERSLAQEHGVNRVTVRTALERLKASGLLTAHVGRGTVVCDVQTQGGPDLLPDLLRDAEASGGLADVVEELFFVRQHLARAVLERIAQRRPNPAPFHRAVAAFAATEPTDLEALASADADVLATLLRLANSQVLQLCLNPVRRLLAEQPALRTAMYRRPSDNVAGWQALGGWLADPHPEDIDVVLSLIRTRDASTVAALRA